MKSINLLNEKPDLSEIIDLAEREPVLLVAPNGHQFILSQADDFDAEVEALRNSARFQAFLDERMKDQVRIPIEDIEREVEEALRKERSPDEALNRTLPSDAG